MKLSYTPCLCVLNITSWAGISIGATHFYGKLTLVEQCTDPDYDQITPDNIEDWRPGGEEIELKKKLTLEEAIFKDEKDNGTTWQYSVMRNPGKILTQGFNSIDEITKFGIKKYKLNFFNKTIYNYICKQLSSLIKLTTN